MWCCVRRFVQLDLVFKKSRSLLAMFKIEEETAVTNGRMLFPILNGGKHLSSPFFRPSSSVASRSPGSSPRSVMKVPQVERAACATTKLYFYL